MFPESTNFHRKDRMKNQTIFIIIIIIASAGEL